MANEAKIKLSAQDATGAAFAAVTKNVQNLKSEAAGLPAKFAQIAIASAGLGSIAGFTAIITSAIESRAQLAKLSVQTNISVEALASLGKVGKLSETSLDDIASASNKLSKALFSQNEDSKGASQGIRALGLDFEKFKSLSPDQQMYAVAKALDKFQDTSEKSALAMLLFGKTGAQMLPFLKDLSENGLVAAKVTAQQAQEALQYEKNLRQLKAAGEEWKKTLADDMLPALLEFSRELVAGRQAYGSWLGAIIGVGTTDPFKDMGESIRGARDEVHGLEDELKKSQSGSVVQRALSRPTDTIESELASARKKYDYFKRLQAMQANGLDTSGYVDARTAIRKPRLNLPDSDSDAKDALLRKQFQGQLKLIHDFAEQQKDGYEFANKYLKNVYDDGLTSLADFYEKQKALRDANLQSELKSIDDEIAAARKFLASAVKPEARQEAENKIAEANVRRSTLQKKTSQENILAVQEEAKAVKALAYSYYDYLANVAALKGDTQTASELRIAKQVQDTQELLRKVGLKPEEADAQAQALGSLLRHTETLSKAQADYNRLFESLGIAEKSVQLDAEAAGQSELDTLRAIGAERQKQLPLLQAMVEKAMQEAQAIGSPEALLNAQKLALAFREIAAQADPIFMRIRDIGKEMGEAAANDAEQAIRHWEGFRKLLSAIEQDILRIGTRKLFTEPFGNFLSNALGGNGQASGGGGFLGSLFGNLLGTGGGGAAPSFAGLGGGAGNFNFGGGFAEGGTLQPGEWGWTGEQGPERIYAGATPVHVYPNEGRAAAGSPVYVTVNVPQGTSRQSASQIAAMVGDRVSAATRRNR